MKPYSSHFEIMRFYAFARSFSTSTEKNEAEILEEFRELAKIYLRLRSKTIKMNEKIHYK